MRTAATLSALLLLALCHRAPADFKSDSDFEKGKVDKFARHIRFKVKAVLGDNKLLVLGTEGSPSAYDPNTKQRIGGGDSTAVKPFVLKRSSDGIVDDQPIGLKGRYRVVGTEKARGKTVWVLEPAGKD